MIHGSRGSLASPSREFEYDQLPASRGQTKGCTRRVAHAQKVVLTMKFLRFGDIGDEKPALVDPHGGIRSLAEHCADLSGGALTDLDKFAKVDWKSLPLVDPSARIGSCVTGVGKFICIGLNFADHAAESGMEVPTEPIIFLKATSAICGPNDGVVIPRGSEKTDWEVELGVVIGKPAKHVPESSALDHVAAIASSMTCRNVHINWNAWVSGPRESRATASDR